MGPPEGGDVNFLGQVWDWFADGSNWTGNRGIVHRLAEHVQMSVVATVAAIIVAVPVALWLGHKRKFGVVAINVSNIGRALPSFAILVLGTEAFGLLEYPVIGSFTTFLALVALAIPPLVTNTYVGVTEVPADIREAARGMGLTELQLLRRVELPLAIPLIMAGVRTAAVQVVATATIAAFVGWGGLGRFIIDGRAIQDLVQVFAGAFLVAALSVVTELALAGVQLGLTPAGLRRRVRTRGVPVTPVLPGVPVEVAA
jgi:osmoprotectant transport system permease protein